MLQLKLPEAWESLEVSPYLANNYPGVHYYVPGKDGGVKNCVSASPEEVLDFARSIDPQINNTDLEPLSLATTRLALMFGVIEKTTKANKDLFGSHEWWGKIMRMEREGRR